MQFKGMRKTYGGKFLHMYEMDYVAENGKKKTYEMASRHGDVVNPAEERKPDAVVIAANDESGEHILISREYRMAIGRYIYNFPAGLIDGDETVEEAAKRELNEETGLELVEVTKVMLPSYSSAGMTDETNVVVIGKAAGEFAPSTSVMEEIEAKWYTKAEVRELLKTEPFCGRCQLYCYWWSKE